MPLSDLCDSNAFAFLLPTDCVCVCVVGGAGGVFIRFRIFVFCLWYQSFYKVQRKVHRTVYVCLYVVLKSHVNWIVVLAPKIVN